MISPLDLSGFENWSSLETAFLWIYDGPVTEELRKAPHFTKPFYALFLHQGTTTIRYDANHKDETYVSGKWIFPKNQEGSHHYSKDAKVLAIRFIVRWPNETPLFDRSTTAVFESSEASPLMKSASRLEKYISKHSLLKDMARRPRLVSTLGNYIAIKELFAGWVLAYYTTFVGKGYEPLHFGALSDRVSRCLRYLRHRALTTPFYEKELADVAGVSVSQLCKVFVQEMGMTPQSFWNTRRVHSARMELSDSDKSIKEIGFTLGFGSPEHFSRWFTKQVGCSPREYRNLNSFPE